MSDFKELVKGYIGAINEGAYVLLNYRKEIASMLDKADLHNEARGKLVENYFGY